MRGISLITFEKVISCFITLQKNAEIVENLSFKALTSFPYQQFSEVFFLFYFHPFKK